MDWDRYKTRCDAPDCFTRWMLQQSLALLDQDSEAFAKISAALHGTPLTKPSGHQGDARTDMFVLSLDVAHASYVLECVRKARRQGERTPATQARGLGGFEEAWRELLEYLASKTGGAMEANERVLGLIDAFNAKDVASLADCFAQEAVYHNMPMEPIQGKQAILESLTPFIESASEIEWVVINSAVSGSTVLNERLDRFLINGRWVEVPVMGVFEVDEFGRIAAWRDYFDLAQFQQQMG